MPAVCRRRRGYRLAASVPAYCNVQRSRLWIVVLALSVPDLHRPPRSRPWRDCCPHNRTGTPAASMHRCDKRLNPRPARRFVPVPACRDKKTAYQVWAGPVAPLRLCIAQAIMRFIIETSRMTTMRAWTTLLAVMMSLSANAATVAAAPADAAPVLLTPDRVWTGDGQAHAGWAVLVAHGKIEAVGPAAGIAAPDGVERIALPGKTLIPGLMDLHSHVLLHPYNETSWDDQVLKESVEYRTLEAARHASDTLQAGFTTLRDLGTEGALYADVAVKRAIEDGVIPGPRMFVATRAIVATGSYGPSVRAYRSDMDIPEGAQEATGVDEVVKAVRGQAARGADWIKVYADYRTGPDGSSRATFSQAELNALVQAAHESGRKTSAHASTDEGMRRAVLAGIDTIEHGYGGSEATFKLMAERHVAFFPTLTAPEAVGEYFQKHERGRPPRMPSRWRASSVSSSATAAMSAFSRTAATHARSSGSSNWA